VARRPRASRLENRTSRLKLEPREKPYDFTSLGSGISLGYRRNRSGGVWVVRVADGRGGNWTRRLGAADDHEDADAIHVFDWWQAQDAARRVARGGDADAGRPATVADAVAQYACDLAARGAGPENATRITKNLTSTLATKPVGLLAARELSAWRDGLLRDGMKPATMVRLGRAVKAALNLAARRDHRITNRNAWGDGFSGLSENFASRNIQRFDDQQVREIIAASYALDPNFGAYAEVAAETGARPSQISRLVVGDLQDGTNPRLTMPTSRKGRGRRSSRYPVPITKQLADKLASIVSAGNNSVGRAPHDPLLTRPDGRRWQETDLGDYARMFEKVAGRLGLKATFYALRHSAIVRSLLVGVPVRIVATSADTSTEMIERTYSAFIGHFADEVARRGLLTPSPPGNANNVAPIIRRGKP
jgi:integrase